MATAATAPRRQGPLLSPIPEQHGRSRSCRRDLPKAQKVQQQSQAQPSRQQAPQATQMDGASMMAFLQANGSLGGVRHPKWTDCQKPVRRSRSTPAAKVHVIWPAATGFQSEPFGGGTPMNGLLAENQLRSLEPRPSVMTPSAMVSCN
jgi:hypothetical protein